MTDNAENAAIARILYKETVIESGRLKDRRNNNRGTVSSTEAAIFFTEAAISLTICYCISFFEIKNETV